MNGIKFDKDKLRWSLLPLKPIEEAIRVMEYGAQKYAEDNWRQVEPRRYRDALMRHLMTVWKDGEIFDKESGYSHYSHALCNLIFLDVLESESRVGKGDTNTDSMSDELLWNFPQPRLNSPYDPFQKYKNNINPVD